jgi:hypothetical protein
MENYILLDCSIFPEDDIEFYYDKSDETLSVDVSCSTSVDRKIGVQLSKEDAIKLKEFLNKYY